MIVFLVFIINIAFIFWSVGIDAEHINEEEYIEDHTSRAMQRFCFYALIAVIDLELCVASFLMYAVLFDFLINYFTNKPFFYLGTVAKWDIFWNKHRAGYLIMKIVFFMSSIALFILLF